MADKRELYKMGCTAPTSQLERGVGRGHPARRREVYGCPWGTLEVRETPFCSGETRVKSTKQRERELVRTRIRTRWESEELEEEETEGYIHARVCMCWGRSVKFHFTLPSAATDGARYGSADTYVANVELVSTP